MRSTQTQCGGRPLAAVASVEPHAPLLLLHGVTRRWQTFLPLWSSLACRWQLHALDFRGHGNSASAAGSYRVTDYAEDVIAYLDAHFQGPVVIYGHSLGAMVAADVAARGGDRVAAVIMEDPPLHTMGNRIGQTPLLSFFQTLQSLAGDPRSVGELARQLRETRLWDPVQQRESRLGDSRDDVSLRFTARCLKQLDPQVLKPIVAGEWLQGFDAESIFNNLHCPSLLIQADPRSGGMLQDEDAAKLETWAADLVRVQVPQCGHLIHWSHTMPLLNHLHGFLESLPASIGRDS